VALNSTHRDGVGFDLHQAHPRATRHALHYAPRYQARTWNALAGHAVKRRQRIARRCGRGATNCDEIRALRRRLWRWIHPRRPDQRRLQLPMGSLHGRLTRECTCILHRQACKAAQAGWQTVPSWLPSMPTPLRRSVRLVASEPRGDGGARDVRRDLNRHWFGFERYRLARVTAGLGARMRIVWVMVRTGLTGWCRPLR